MSNPAKPGWPDASALPFTFFGAQSPAASAATKPLASGIAGGLDLIKNFWGNLPGGSALPGFLVPTVDVEELDKRIADLRAAESWLDVNMNMLRATIQGLEVQRHTIAAIQSLSAMGSGAGAGAAAKASATAGLPSGWPMPASSAASPEPAPRPAASPAPAEVAPEPPAAASALPDEDAAPVDGGASEVTAAPPNLLAGLAASNWLGFMQDQFSKVAQAALSTSPRAAAGAGATHATPPPAKTARKAASKKARARRSTARKRGDA